MLDAALALQVSGSIADWMTAVGTCAAAFVALGVALWSWRRVGDEQKRSTEREQLAEAYQVQVLLAEESVTLPTGTEPVNEFGDPVGIMRCLVAIIVNRGAYTITDVECTFRLASRSETLVHPCRTEWLSGFAGLPERLRSGSLREPDFNPGRGRLAPWDTGLLFESDPMPGEQLHDSIPIVRWKDRWMISWEYRPGGVRQIGSDAPWAP